MFRAEVILRSPDVPPPAMEEMVVVPDKEGEF